MSPFTVRGRFQGRDGWERFETEVDAANEAVAEEHVYANFGGRHGLKRNRIEIEEIEAA